MEVRYSNRSTPLLITVLLISGCASVQQTYAPDGRKAYALNCSGLARGWDKCQQAAGEICGSAGYDVVDRASEDLATVSGDEFSFGGAKTQERSMLIACKRKK
jgi:hypothetical protein